MQKKSNCKCNMWTWSRMCAEKNGCRSALEDLTEEDIKKLEEYAKSDEFKQKVYETLTSEEFKRRMKMYETKPLSVETLFTILP